ncbi:MAG: glycosyltransferase [Porphyrobacter sp.]|nr:glycosyltransferase [Porphyrobacter sp.]
MQTFQTSPEMPELSVVIPVYNEEAVLDVLIERVVGASAALFDKRFELILVNDGSRDGSWEAICRHADRDPRVVGLNLSRNHGHQLALTAGLCHARGAVVFVLDADLQDPPELLGPMLAKLREGYDVVYGQRTKRHGETAFKRGTAALFYRLLRTMIATDIPPDTGDFRLMTRRVVDQLNAMPERYRFIRGMVSFVGFRQAAFPYERDARYAGETSYPLGKMIAFALDAVTSFSVVPLRFASHLGLLFGISGLLALSWIVWASLRGATVEGWASLAALILIMGSVQLMVLGIFGEYIGRMYMEAKRRPLFIVSDIRSQAGAVGGAADSPVARMEEKLHEAFRAAS